MVAMAMIAIALTAVLGAQARNVSMANRAGSDTRAALLAQGKMAELEAIRPDELSSGSGGFGDDFPGYEWQSTVEDADLDSRINISGRLKRIDLKSFRNDDMAHEYMVRMYRFVPEIK